MCRLLVVQEYGDRAPSGTVRGLAYRDLFAAHGIETTFITRTPFEMLDFLEAPPRFIRRIARRRAIRRRLENMAWDRRRRKIIQLARRHDVVYLNKVLHFPLIRALRDASQARLVLDFGDAMWLYQAELDKFHETLGLVDAVTTDNEETARYIRRFNREVVVVPDAPQLEEFDKRRGAIGQEKNGQITIGWLGSPGTAYNLYAIWDALEELFARHQNLRLRLVGAGHNLALIPPFEKVRFSVCPGYNQAEMIEEVFRMDIGLFPLQNVEKSRVRGVLKATVYMSGEAAVVASPVGQNAELIEDGVNGFLADSKDEWIDKLERLIKDAELRRRLAAAGLQTVRKGFTLEQSFLKLKSVLFGEELVRV